MHAAASPMLVRLIVEAGYSDASVLRKALTIYNDLVTQGQEYDQASQVAAKIVQQDGIDVDTLMEALELLNWLLVDKLIAYDLVAQGALKAAAHSDARVVSLAIVILRNLHDYEWSRDIGALRDLIARGIVIAGSHSDHQVLSDTLELLYHLVHTHGSVQYNFFCNSAAGVLLKTVSQQDRDIVLSSLKLLDYFVGIKMAIETAEKVAIKVITEKRDLAYVELALGLLDKLVKTRPLLSLEAWLCITDVVVKESVYSKSLAAKALEILKHVTKIGFPATRKLNEQKVYEKLRDLEITDQDLLSFREQLREKLEQKNR